MDARLSAAEQNSVIKPRRKFKLLLTGGLLLGLLWFAPAIIANSPLRQQLLPALVPQYPARVQVGTATLGWMSPVVLRDVNFHDLDGRPFLKTAAISTQETLLEIISNSTAVHPIQISGAVVDVRLREEGSNVEDVLEPFLDPTSVIWPGVMLEIAGGSLTIISGNEAEGKSFDDLKISVQKPNDQGTAYEIQVSATCGGGTLESVLSWIPPAELTSPAAGDGTLSLSTEKLPFQHLQPILDRFAPNNSIAAELSATTEIDWSTSGESPNYNIHGQFSTGPVEVIAPGLAQTEQVHAEFIRCALEAKMVGDRVSVVQLQLDSDLAQLQIHGGADLTGQVEGDLLQSLFAALSGEACEVHGKIDLAKLAETLPETLHIRPGTRIISGSVEWYLVHKISGKAPVWDGRIKTSHLKAINQGKHVTWEEPIQLSLSAERGPSGFPAVQLTCEANFLKLSLRGKADELALHLKCDLDRLADEAGQFVDLGGLELSGQLGAVANARRQNERVEAEGTVQINGLHVAGWNEVSWDEPRLKMACTAAGIADGMQLTRIENAELQLSAVDYDLEAELMAATDWGGGGESLPIGIALRGDLGSWKSRLQPLLPAGIEKIAGAVSLQTDLNIAPGKIGYQNATLLIDNFALNTRERAIRQKQLRIDSAGSIDIASAQFETVQTTITTSAAAIKANDVAISYGGENIALVGRVELVGQLEDIWAVSESGPPPATGEATVLLDFNQIDGVTHAQTNVAFNNLTIPQSDPDTKNQNGKRVARLASRRTGQSPLWQSERALLSAKWSYDPKRDEILFDKIYAAADAVDLEAKGKINNLLATPMANISGTINGDWEILLAEYRDLVGEGIKMTGTRRHPFSLRGPLTTTGDGSSGADLLIPKNLKVALTLGWDSANIHGLQTGRGEVLARLQNGIVRTAPLDIPVSEGRLTAVPRVLLDRVPGLFVLPAGPVIQNVRFSPELCHGWLKYVAPMVADSTHVDGRLSVEMTRTKVPLDDWRSSAVAGVLKIHSADVSPGPLAQQFLEIAEQVKAIIKKKPGSRIVDPGDAWMKIGEQEIAFRMANGRVHHEMLEISFRDVVIRTRGSVGLDETLALIAEIPIQDAWLKDDRLLATLRGQVLEVPITGTLTKPEVDRRVLQDLLSQITAAAGKNLLQNELQDQLQRLLRGK